AVRIERQRDDQIDHGLHVQFLLPLFPGRTVGEHVLDHLRGQDRFQLRQREMIGGLAVRFKLAYGNGHRKAPPCDGFSLIPVCHNLWPFFLHSTFFLSKWYCPMPLHPCPYRYGREATVSSGYEVSLQKLGNWSIKTCRGRVFLKE